MDVSVAICTWNRAELLAQTLAALRELEVPADLSWELVVVDNGSTDETAALLDKHRDLLPLHVVEEPRRGYSRARNRAIDTARGDLICWTDDDVRVEPGWLASYARAAREQPETSFFGGPILPWFEADPPAWVEQGLAEIGSAFALCDHGPRSVALGRERLPYGANFAVRAAAQRRQRFDPKLGRVGKQLLSGDEIDMLLRLLSEGAAGRWLPDARVRHHIPRERMTADYVRRFYRGVGATWAVALTGRRRWLRLLRAALVVARLAPRYALVRRGRDPRAWCRTIRDLETAWGELTGRLGRTSAP